MRRSHASACRRTHLVAALEDHTVRSLTNNPKNFILVHCDSAGVASVLCGQLKGTGDETKTMHVGAHTAANYQGAVATVDCKTQAVSIYLTLGA